MGKKVVVVRQNGTTLTVDEKDLATFKKLGYREESQTESAQKLTEATDKDYYTGTFNKVLAGGEGLLSGLSLGATDVILPDDGAGKRAEYNPGTRIAGEIIGAIAPAVLTGGASLEASGGRLALKAAGREALALTPAGQLARAGRAIETSIGGTKGAIAAGAFEGGVGGVASAISQAQLNDDPLTIESLISNGTIGAIAGGGLGGLGAKLSAVKPAADEVFEGATSGLVRTEGDVLDEFYASMPKDKTTKGISELPETAGQPYAVEKYTEKELVQEAVPTESFGNIRKNLQTPIDNIASASKEVDNALKASATSFDELNREIDWFTSKATGIKGVNKEEFNNPYKKLKASLKSKDVEGIDEALSEYNTVLETHAQKLEVSHWNKQTGNKIDPDIQDQAIRLSEVRKFVKSFDTAAKSAKKLITLKESVDILKEFPDKIEDFRKLRAPKAEKLFAALDVVGDNPEFSAIGQNIDTVLADMGLSTTGSSGNRARTVWESTKTPQFFKEQEKLTNKARLKIDLDMADTNGFTKNEAGILPRKPGVAVDTELDELGKRISGDLPTGTPTLDLASGLSFSPDELISPAYSRAPGSGRGGSRINKFWKSAAQSAGRRLASSGARKVGLGVLGSAIAFEAGGSATDMLVGGMFGSTVAGGRTGTVSRLARAARKAAPYVGKGTSAVRGQYGKLNTRLDGSTDDKEDVKARIEEVNNFAPIARDRAFQAVEELAVDQPAFVKAFIDSVDSFAKTLQSFMPRDPGLAFNRGKSLWEPDPVQRAQTAKALAVAHDPEGTAEYIASGQADMFTINAFKALWPGQHQEFVVGVLDNIIATNSLETMDYEAQNYYSTVTGIPFHSSFSPRSMAQTQAVYAASSEKERESKNSIGGKTQKGGRPAKTEPPTTGQSLLT